MKKSLFERVFFRGENLSKEQKKELLTAILPILNNAGFKQVKTYFDGNKRRYNSILFERRENQIYYYISVAFDKYYRPRFSITLTKHFYENVLQQCEVVQFVKNRKQAGYWWGAKFWSINHDKAWLKAVRKSSQALPQLIEYIDDKIVGPNISDHRFTRN